MCEKRANINIPQRICTKKPLTKLEYFPRQLTKMNLFAVSIVNNRCTNQCVCIVITFSKLDINQSGT